MSYSSSLNALIDIQSFDPETKTFAAHFPKTKKIDLAAVWISPPFGGLGGSELLAIQSILAAPFEKDTVIHFGELSTPDIAAPIAEYMSRKHDAQSPVIRELVQRQADLIKEGTTTAIIPSSGVLVSTKRLIITMRVPYDAGGEKNVELFNETAGKFESSLNAAGFRMVRADANEYLALMRLITHMYDPIDSRYDESLGLNEQVFYSGDEIKIHRDHLEMLTGGTPDSNYFATALSPKFLPRDFSIGMMNHVIGDPKGVHNQIRYPYYLSLTLHYPDQLEKKSAIDQRANWISHQLFGGSASRFMTTLGLKKEGFDTLRTELETRSGLLVEAVFTFWLFPRRLDQAKAHIEDIRTYWTSLGFEMRLDKNILDVLYGQSVPLGASKIRSFGLNRTHTLTSSQASQFLPILGEWRGTKHATTLLTTRRGELAGFDLFSHKSSYSAILVASPGSGKSFVTQRLITDYLAEGAKVWVIDQGFSYQKLAASCGGTFLEFGPDSDICLNPWTDFLEERGGEDRLINDEMDVLASLVERMAAQREQFDDIDMEIIKKAIRQTFIEYQGHTTIRNVAEWLMAQHTDDRARNLAVRLDSFSHGQYAKFFNGHANVNMKNDFVVLELDGLSQQRQLQQVVLLQIVNQITNEMFNSNNRKQVLVIDEAWSLINDPIMSRAMVACAKKARKNQGSLVTVCQGLSDMYSSEAGRALLDSTAWQIILNQRTEAIDAVKASGNLALDDYSFEMLKTLSTVNGSHSEMMIVGDGCAGIFRLTVDKFTQAMFASSGSSRIQVLEDIKNGMDALEAVERNVVGSEAVDYISAIRKLANEAERVGINKSEVKRMVADALT